MANSVFVAERYNDRDLIASILNSYYIVDYGMIQNVNADKTVNVVHAKNLKMRSGKALKPTTTKNVEMLTLSAAGFALEIDYNIGDKVLLLGLKDYVPKVSAVVGGTPTTNYLHYARETLKALPLCVFSSAARVKVKADKGKLSVDTLSDMSATAKGKIELDAIGEIKASSKSKIGLDAIGDINASAKGQFKAEGATGFSIKSNATGSVEATTLSLKGNAQLQLNGSGKFLVTWTELNTALTVLWAAIQTHTHIVATAGGPTSQTGTASPSIELASQVLNLAAAKTNTVVTGG